jgi:phospholipase C
MGGVRFGRWATFGVVAAAFAVLVGVVALASNDSGGARHGRGTLAASAPTPRTPIQHVVLIYQENRSLDHVLGAMCAAEHRCDCVTTGKLVTGATIPLSHAADVTPPMHHKSIDQSTGVDGGRMDGFENIEGCEGPAYACYSQYQPSDIPVLTALGYTGDNPSTNMNYHSSPG